MSVYRVSNEPMNNQNLHLTPMASNSQDMKSSINAQPIFKQPIDSSTPVRPTCITNDNIQLVSVNESKSLEDIKIEKINGAMGLSIVGGSNIPCHPFGINDPGIFISKIVANGAASRTNLRVGDRILKVNGVDVTKASHDEAVDELKRNREQVLLTVRHEPQPKGLQEIIFNRSFPEETIGIRIHGGIENKAKNLIDPTDEGIFITDVS